MIINHKKTIGGDKMKPDKKACDMTTRELAAYIDYSVLKPEFTEEEIIELTKDGVKLGCATICINPGYMELCEPYVKRDRHHALPGNQIFHLEQAQQNLKLNKLKLWLNTIRLKKLI